MCLLFPLLFAVHIWAVLVDTGLTSVRYIFPSVLSQNQLTVSRDVRNASERQTNLDHESRGDDPPAPYERALYHKPARRQAGERRSAVERHSQPQDRESMSLGEQDRETTPHAQGSIIVNISQSQKKTTAKGFGQQFESNAQLQPGEVPAQQQSAVMEEASVYTSWETVKHNLTQAGFTKHELRKFKSDPTACVHAPSSNRWRTTEPGDVEFVPRTANRGHLLKILFPETISCYSATVSAPSGTIAAHLQSTIELGG